VIRAVISDFGGVLTTPLSAGFLAYQEEAGVSLEELGGAIGRAAEAYGEHPLYALERGEIAEAEFARRLEEQLPVGFDLARLRELYFERIDPNAAMIRYLGELRGRGLRTALLTNNVREWEPLWRAKLPELEEIFELVVDSAFVGMRKPERRIYELTLERLGGGLRAEECLFVDDLEVNCDGARALGMTAVRFEDAGQAIEELEAAISRNVRADRRPGS
jgi:putative hydrolase of the HAD superfamily